MKKLTCDQKIGVGLALTSFSFLLGQLSPNHSLNVLAFFQGLTVSLGLVFLMKGSIEKRRMKK